MATKKTTSSKKTYEIPNSKGGYTTVKASSKQEAVSKVSDSKLKTSSSGGSSSSSKTVSPSVQTTTQMLKQGSKGSEVAALQKQLGITADGIFGPQTEAAVRAYQSSKGLASDGIVGPNTFSSLSNKSTKSDKTYMVKEGDAFNPFNGKPLTDQEKIPGTVINDEAMIEAPVQEEEVEAPQGQDDLVPVEEGAPAAPQEGEVVDDGTGAVVEQPQPSTYTGASIVDYLSSIGQPSDFSSRAALAATNGIPNYIGSQSQNTQLLNTLRQQGAGGDASIATNGADAGMGSMGGDEGEPTDDGDVIEPKSQFQQDIEGILEEFGITPPSELQSPQSSFSDTYQQVYENLGLQDIKDQYDLFSKEYGDLQDEKREKINSINNDPWLTEGVRIDRLRKLDADYELRESNALSKIKLMETMYENGRQDAQFVTGGIMDQYNKSQALTQDIIMKAIDIAESRSQSEKDLLGDQAASVINLIETYPDAGIKTTDSLEVAAQKASKSAFFEKKIKSTSTGTKPKTKFTQSQLNKGAANAGLAIEQFVGLDDDTKNVFINNPGFVKVFKEDLASYTDGNLSKDEWIEQIQNASGEDSIKEGIISIINSLPDQEGSSDGGFWDNAIVKGLVGVGDFIRSVAK